MKIRGKEIRNYGEPLFIAEIGCNYDGDIDIAKKLIFLAKEIGCDVAKFQSFDKGTLFTKSFYMDKPGDLKTETLEQTLDRLTLKDSDIDQLISHCRKADIGFASTPVANVFVDSLANRRVEFIKVASFDMNNLPFLKYVAAKGLPIVLSVGLGSLQEVEDAINAIFSTGNKDLILLHCAAAYPPKDENIHLQNIDLLRDYFGLPVGFSDHSKGFAVPLAAIARGACVIEKHFTYDSSLDWGDHPVSAGPQEMKIIVEEGRRVQKALGQYQRTLTNDDIEYRKMLRRSAVSSRELKKGEKIVMGSLDFKRPGTGIQFNELPYLLNRRLKKDVASDELIAWEDLE